MHQMRNDPGLWARFFLPAEAWPTKEQEKLPASASKNFTHFIIDDPHDPEPAA